MQQRSSRSRHAAATSWSTAGGASSTSSGFAGSNGNGNGNGSGNGGALGFTSASGGPGGTGGDVAFTSGTGGFGAGVSQCPAPHPEPCGAAQSCACVDGTAQLGGCPTGFTCPEACCGHGGVAITAG